MKLREHAEQQILLYEAGEDVGWFFWRGVLLGIESRESEFVTPEWADAVLRVNLKEQP